MVSAKFRHHGPKEGGCLVVPYCTLFQWLWIGESDGQVRTKRSEVGFTLVEILVVMAIIAVTTSLVMAVTVRFREKGKQTACLSNLRQLGMASLMYTKDYNECLPCFINSRRSDPVGRDNFAGYSRPDLLYAALKPYVGGEAVWFCPNDPIAGQDVFRWGVRHKYSSYGFNFRRKRFTVDGFSLPGLEILPTEYKLIGDCNVDYFRQLGEPDFVPMPGCEHFHGINIFYLDGHANWIAVPRVRASEISGTEGN